MITTLPRSKGPQMHPVVSSNIQAIGYSPGPDGKPGNLYVDFKTGTRYVYEDVPADVFPAFLKAESPGQFHARRVKGVYGYRKTEREL